MNNQQHPLEEFVKEMEAHKAATRNLRVHGLNVIVNTGGPDYHAKVEDQTAPNEWIHKIGCFYVSFRSGCASWVLPAHIRTAEDKDFEVSANGITFPTWQQAVWLEVARMSCGIMIRKDDLQAMRPQWRRCANPKDAAAEWLRPHLPVQSEQGQVRPRVLQTRPEQRPR